MITIKQTGNFKNTERFLSNVKRLKVQSILNRYGREDIRNLSNATPRRTGLTAESWEYNIELARSGRWVLSWHNTNLVNGTKIAILIQYGHGTKSGTYVQGIDYINPAMKSIFDTISESIWKEILSL